MDRELFVSGLEEIAEENQRNSEKLMKEVYREKKKQRDEIIKYIISLYAAYEITEKGLLKLSQSDKRKVSMQTKDILTSLAAKLGTNEEKAITKALEESVSNTYGKTNFLIQLGVNFDLPIGGLDEKAISKIINKQLEGKSFSTRIWNNQQLLINQLNREINDIIFSGKDVNKATKIIKDRFNVSATNAKRIVVNETKNVQVRTQGKIYRENDLIKKVMWSATIDEKTREEHRHLDGKVWDSNETHPTPEQFVNCRCSLVPIVEGWNPTKRRDNQSKDIVDYETYNEWAKEKGIN